jgi:SAM-dependent methyltransferase
MKLAAKSVFMAMPIRGAPVSRPGFPNIMQHSFSYTGTGTLEVLSDARNYNRFLEDEILAFIKPEMRALDFGAGIGEFARRLRARDVEVTCVELDSQQLRRLRESGFTSHAGLSGAPSASRIYSLNVLEHIQDDGEALSDIWTKLAPGGKLFLYVPAFMCLYTSFDQFVGHCRRYTRAELQQKTAAAGFVVERCEYVDSIGFLCWFIMGRLPGNKTSINPVMVKIFDRVLFPVSRGFDRLFSRIFGKNLLLIARKP